MIDKERQRFEAWAAVSQYKLDVTPGSGESAYKYYGCDVAWAAWQAAIGLDRTCCRKHLMQTEQLPLRSSLLVVCRTCGNKRCPKATDCDLDCTGSNEPGQIGSVYTAESD